MGHIEVFVVLVIKNRFWSYYSLVNLPRTQLLAPKLEILLKLVVSVREAFGAELSVLFTELALLVFSHWFVSLL